MSQLNSPHLTCLTLSHFPLEFRTTSVWVGPSWQSSPKYDDVFIFDNSGHECNKNNGDGLLAFFLPHQSLSEFTRNKDRFSPWFCHDLATLIHQKNSLWKKAHSSQSSADWLAVRPSGKQKSLISKTNLHPVALMLRSFGKLLNSM